MSDSVDDQNEVVLTEAQSKKLKDWNKMVREKHSVPENYCVMIDKANIDLVINNESQYKSIPVYDEWNTLCNCSFGVITPICSEKYEGGELHERVAHWKAAIREKYNVPEEYEIIMCYYGESNDIEHWIANCEQMNRVLVKDASERTFARYLEGEMQYMPSKKEYLYKLSNPFCMEHGKMTQHDSDRLGHFLQVITILHKSNWFNYKNKLQLNMNKDGKIRADMPELELTAFALLYIRQLIDSNDDLIKIACNIYCRFCSNIEKREYIKSLKENLIKYLNEPPSFIPLTKLVQSNIELIEVFQYGALIMHQPDNINDPKVRDIFKTMYLRGDERVQYIFELNNVLKQVVCQASSIAVFIQKDFGIWIAEDKVLAPDVMWQNNMFTWDNLVEKKANNDNVSSKPVFGVPYNVEFIEK